MLTITLNNCDYKGGYEDKEVSDMYLIQKTRVGTVSEKCLSHFNTPEWFEHCEPFCKYYDPLMFSETFEPNISKFIRLKVFYK